MNATQEATSAWTEEKPARTGFYWFKWEPDDDYCSLLMVESGFPPRASEEEEPRHYLIVRRCFGSHRGEVHTYPSSYENVPLDYWPDGQWTPLTPPK